MPGIRKASISNQGATRTLKVTLSLDLANGTQEIGRLDIRDGHLADGAFQKAEQIIASCRGGGRPALVTVSLPLGAVFSGDGIEGVLRLHQGARLVALLLQRRIFTSRNQASGVVATLADFAQANVGICPSPSFFSRPSTRYLRRQSRPPLGWTSRNRKGIAELVRLLSWLSVPNRGGGQGHRAGTSPLHGPRLGANRKEPLASGPQSGPIG